MKIIHNPESDLPELYYYILCILSLITFRREKVINNDNFYTELIR